ncbi:MAG: methyltransferase domain-containing protein [Candidatus Krumholzibacteriota bacterium]|nr:methyltransferase domain-containing protein [Candidatus Krumholzibacteriota bacterium]
MDSEFRNVYDDEQRARAYAQLDFPGTYYLAFRDLSSVFENHAKGKRAVDFGCGTGRSTRFLRDLGFEVVGIDISRPMLDEARRLDPDGDYRLVKDGDFGGLKGCLFDLVLSAFTFDNIPTMGERKAALLSLKDLLAEDGCIVSVVSAPEIYINEWVSFSTRDYPENRNAVSGDRVLIEILGVGDARPVEDSVCSDDDYQRLFRQSGLSVLETLRPLAKGNEPVKWVSETEIAPWTVYVLGAGS